MEDISLTLEKIGLSRQESRCYIVLYQLKESRAGALSRKAGIATANIYPVLDSLIQKGLASFKVVNNTRVYMPAPAESFELLIEQKQKYLDEQKSTVRRAIQHLKQQELPTDSFAGYKFFSGIAGVKSMWLEILSCMSDEKKPHTLKIYSSTRRSSEHLLAFYDDFHKKRKALGHTYKIIMSDEFPEHAAKRRKDGAQVKMTTIRSDASYGVFGAIYFVSYSIGKQPIGLLISDANIAHGFDEIFEKLWDSIR